MRYLTLTLMILSACLMAEMLPAHAASAPSESGYSSEAALMIIRFNQPHVSYEMPLYKTIAAALDEKPSAVFDIVSVSARANDLQKQKMNNQIATQNVRKVLATLHEIGLPDSRIKLSSASDKVTSSEVRVFVH